MIIICSICVLYQYNNTQVNNSQERENPIRSSLAEYLSTTEVYIHCSRRLAAPPLTVNAPHRLVSTILVSILYHRALPHYTYSLGKKCQIIIASISTYLDSISINIFNTD